jgi:hypothetical protein
VWEQQQRAQRHLVLLGQAIFKAAGVMTRSGCSAILDHRQEWNHHSDAKQLTQSFLGERGSSQCSRRMRRRRNNGPLMRRPSRNEATVEGSAIPAETGAHPTIGTENAVSIDLSRFPHSRAALLLQ